MAETDWREILNYSQRELIQADKEKLCENLSWMEADDIELNFTDLKTLFRLAQDILKYKSEQVNNLKGQCETLQRKLNKAKMKGSYSDSPARGSDSGLETINHQEEVIKANKDILEQLYVDIAELEGKKIRLLEEKNQHDKDSESSRDVLSELNEVAQLENEITVKNRHIRKLLSDVKILEEENTKLKEKLTVTKDKLNEATKLIENLTEQLLALNNESLLLKDALGKSEENKAHLSVEIEALRKQVFLNDSNRENMYDEIKSKVQHWKNVAKMKKGELETLTNENTYLKESLMRVTQSEPSLDDRHEEEKKIKELQEKLSQASKEIENSAYIIENLKMEIRSLKSTAEEQTDDHVSDTKNVSDEYKEKIIMNKMKKRIKTLTIALQEAEERISIRDKELSEITSHLQLVQSDEGIKSLLEGLKNKKRQLKSRDEGIKSLVQEINTLNQLVDDLQLQNESLRLRFNLPRNEEIPTKGILKKLYEVEMRYKKIDKTLKKNENKLIATELDNYILSAKCNKFSNLLVDMGCEIDLIEQINTEAENYDESASRGDREKVNLKINSPIKSANSKKSCNCEVEMQAFIDENEGLRKGLQEILNFLKDNSATSSGVLSVECPSLDAILQSMEARHSAGWFAPHMSTVMELRAALGGRDALLTALHEARKETFEIMGELSKEINKSRELEKKLQAVEAEQSSKTEDKDHVSTRENKMSTANVREFGSWVSLEDDNFDFGNLNSIESHIAKQNSSYEDYLKKGLNYFYEKFKILFEKMTNIVIHTADQQNQWSLQEEQYKAQIESLKVQVIQKEEEDISEDSPGLMPVIDVSSLQRKCSYLEESYKYIRTLNENMKNEILENKKDNMLTTLEYETQIQSLMLIIANLFDKLRYSISIELFWKQNAELNEVLINYRKILDAYLKNNENIDLLKYFNQQKTDIINILRNNLEQHNGALHRDNMPALLSDIEQLLAQKSIKKLCDDLTAKDSKIKTLEAKNIELQETQAKMIDECLAKDTNEEIKFLRTQLQKLTDDNKILKDQYQHIESQLDIALLQLQDNQHRKLSNDIEINMLRHQILDLQSTGDNKAIIARLSGEVLVAHLQATESHKKLEQLNASLNKEKQSRIETEEMLKARQKIFDIYTMRYETKFKYMFDIMQILRQQYHGSLPVTTLENYINKMEEFTCKTHAVNDKLEEIEDLQYSLMTKHSVYEQVLDLSKNKCLEEQDGCSHKLKNMVLEKTRTRDVDHYIDKIKVLEKSREDLRNHCNKLENILILLNQGFEKTGSDKITKKYVNNMDPNPELELEDIYSDDESNSRRSQTITLKKPQILNGVEKTNIVEERNPIAIAPCQSNESKKAMVNVSVQVVLTHNQQSISTQTDTVHDGKKLFDEIKEMNMENIKIAKELAEAKTVAVQKSEEIVNLTSQKIRLETKLERLEVSINDKEKNNEVLLTTIEDLKMQYDELKNRLVLEKNQLRDAVNEENKSLLLAIKQLENDKNTMALDYQELLQNERQEYAQATKALNEKIMQLQTHLDRKENENNASKADAVKDVIGKYTLRVSSLEDKCFKTQSEFDSCRTDMITLQSELERWKDLAIERLAKMEQLNSQLEERHCHEVESYKAENQHWISQLNETQREHMELRSRLSEQKALHMKQIADKDAAIEQLRSAINALKTQIISMQTLISVNDPSFDLSAIVEVDESIDVLSQQGSDRLELKFDSSVDMHEMQDELMRMPASSTAIWHEPVIDRLRRDKQLASKQNAILRRQIKALAARERRARLDAQNLKNQVFRISTSGSKAANVETAALQNKIASLQTQLSSARRDSQSSVALWDKWKRAQQATERWQARYEEKCQEVKKVEMSLNLAKSAVVRLEKEKRLLLTRLSEARSEKQMTLEKQDSEVPEKSSWHSDTDRSSPPPPVSTRALLDRVQAQQRRIAALELAEKGNELLVSEYERALAEITSLKGQVLKLESTLLESQIRTPLQTTSETQPEVDYWKSYCEMLKEENVQLNLRINALDTAPITASQHRVNDLEQTVLTLRGLVSKLQAEHKASMGSKRGDSRPNSGRISSDMARPKQLDTYRIEIANLKRSIQDKDLLLEKSKEMLKIAAEREDELLRENKYLRRRLEEITHSKGGFLSA